MMELTWADQMQSRGKADTLLKILAVRKLNIEQTQKDSILACTDMAQIDTWVEKALTATTADQVFGKPAKAKTTKKK
jgi:hypothetical protein